MSERLNVDEPLWDLNTFAGRWKHFLWVTDPRTVTASDEELEEAKNILELYKKHQEPSNLSTNHIIHAKKLYESAFHPDSGEKQNVFGRMSFQVPGGMLVTGAMLQWYRTVPAVVFWQWVNQSFNALVNYTNRNAKSPLTTNQLIIAYVSASSAACITAIGCKSFLQKYSGPFFQRYVPFAAVAAANCVNIPLMRQNELIDGVDLQDENGKMVCQSKVAPVKGIAQVIFSRIVMCAPGMLILPIIMNKLETYKWMQAIKPLHAPIQITLVGCFLTVMVPTACALFPQRCSYPTILLQKFESEEYEKLKKFYGKDIPMVLYFNKGL